MKEKSLFERVKKNKAGISLLLIILFSFFIRTIYLDSDPPGFYTDEVISAYDAYSLLHTGKDSYGVFLPMFFRAADDYRDPIHTYSMIPFIILLGPSIFAIRLVSAVYGTLAVLLTYFVVKKVFDKRTAILASLFLAVSPWDYIVSRISFHTITYTPFFLLGVYLFYVWLKDRKKNHLMYCAATFGIGCYSYYPSRLWIPMFIAALLLIYRKEVWRRKNELVAPMIIFSLLYAPLVYILFFSPEKATMRFNAVSIFNPDILKETRKEMTSTPYLAPYAASNNAVYLYKYLENYWAHLSPDFLFFKGDDNPRHNVAGFGKLYLFQIPLVALGILICLVRRKEREQLLLYWLITYPIAASFTCVGIPHSLRTINAVPVFDILSAYAAITVLAFSLNKRAKGLKRYLRIPALLLLLALSVYALTNVYSFYDHYFNEYPKYAYPHLHTKIGDALAYTESVKDRYDKIIVASDCCYYLDYYMAFFTKQDPNIFHKNNRSFIDPSGKYETGYARSFCERYPNSSKILYVLKGDKFLNLSLEKTIYNPDNTTAFRIGTNCSLLLSPYIQNWLLCGTFPNNRSAAITPENYWDTGLDNGLFIDYINESKSYPNSGEPCGAKTWTYYGNLDQDYIDLAQAFASNEQVISYAGSYVYSPKSQQARIWYGSDDGIAIWLNGIQVTADHAHRPAVPDSKETDIYLKEGWNTLLMKVEQVTGGWGFYARITDLDDNAIPGLQYQVVRP